MSRIVSEEKNLFDIVYLSDDELNINSGHENERPCIVLNIDYEDNSGFVIPITSKNKMYNVPSQHKLSFGSFIDLQSAPIKIDSNTLRYSRLADFTLDNCDIDVLENWYDDWF